MVFERIKEMLEETVGEDIHITPDATLMADLSLDSLDIVELILDLEAEFGAETFNEEREKIRTVADLVNLIEENM